MNASINESTSEPIGTDGTVKTTQATLSVCEIVAGLKWTNKRVRAAERKLQRHDKEPDSPQAKTALKQYNDLKYEAYLWQIAFDAKIPLDPFPTLFEARRGMAGDQ